MLGLAGVVEHTHYYTEFGSYVYIGEMITNLPFPPDEQVEDGCGDCTLCIDLCPTGARSTRSIKCANVPCLSDANEGFMPDEFRQKMGNQLYSYDNCQVVCPKIEESIIIFIQSLNQIQIWLNLNYCLLLTMQIEFKEKFGHMAEVLRGKKPIQRNAIIALANYKEESAVDELIKDEQRSTSGYSRNSCLGDW